jgi:transcriptional regulator with XRE-family HTH domain
MTTAGDSPAAARRHVRLAVRRAREALGLTQGQVAEAMEWSLSKVMRIENGEVTIAPNDLRPLLSYLGIKDKTTVDELTAAAKLSKQRRQWWDSPEVRDGLTPALRQVVQLEPHAAAIRYFFPLIVPGRLQVPSYSRALFEPFRPEIPDHVIRARLAVRLQRRNSLLSLERPPRSYVILDESVLRRPIGGVSVLREQLSDLLSVMAGQSVLVRIIPFGEEAPIPLMANYEIFYLQDDENDDDAILYRENDIQDEIVEEPDKIRRHRLNFERLWNKIYDEKASARLIKERLAALSEDGT